MFSINQQAINGQSLLHSALMGSTEAAQHSEERHQPDQIFHAHQYNPLYPSFLKHNSAEHLSCTMPQTAPLWPQALQSRHGHRQNPHELLHKISTSSHNQTVLGVPPAPSSAHRAPALLLFHWHLHFYSQASTNSAAAVGKEWAALTEHLREQKSQECGREQPTGKSCGKMLWSDHTGRIKSMCTEGVCQLIAKNKTPNQPQNQNTKTTVSFHKNIFNKKKTHFQLSSDILWMLAC